MALSENIKKYRKESGLTQRQLAKKCDLATGTIQQYELGKRKPKIEQVQKMSAALGVSISELLDPDVLSITNSMIELFANSEIKELETVDPSTVQEHFLMLKFRELNEKGQNKVVDYADDLSKTKEYVKKET